MRKLSLILFSFLFIVSCNEEEAVTTQSGFDNFYDLHERDEGVITIGMPVFIFKLFIDRSNKNVKKAVDQIETIDLFIKEKSDEAYISEVYRHFPSRVYKNLFSSKSQDVDIKFMVKEKKEKVDELIMIVNEKTDKNCVVLRIGGSFTVKDIKRLAEKIDVNDLVKYR